MELRFKKKKKEIFFFRGAAVVLWKFFKSRFCKFKVFKINENCRSNVINNRNQI